MKSRGLFGLFRKAKNLTPGPTVNTAEAAYANLEASASNTTTLSPLLMSLTNGNKEMQKAYQDYLAASQKAHLSFDQGDYQQARVAARQAVGYLTGLDSISPVVGPDYAKMEKLLNLINENSVKNKC